MTDPTTDFIAIGLTVEVMTDDDGWHCRLRTGEADPWVALFLPWSITGEQLDRVQTLLSHSHGIYGRVIAQIFSDEGTGSISDRFLGVMDLRRDADGKFVDTGETP